MGASSLLPPLQEVYSQFQVLCLKCSQQREKSMHLSVKLSEKPFKTGMSRKIAFWFTLRLFKVKNCRPQPGLALPSPIGHRGIAFVPPSVHLLQHAVDHSTGFPVDLTVEKRSPVGSIRKVFSYISVRACSGHIPSDFLILMNSQTSAELSV